MWASGRLASRTQKTNARQSAFVWEVNSLTWQGNHRTRFTSQKTTTGSRRSEEGTSGLRSYSVNEPITGSSSRRGTRVPFDLHQGQLRQSSVARRATSSSSTGTGSDEIDAQNNDESAAEETPILRGLNPSQVKAVTQPVASVTRVVAGPGSGKTRVLTSRIAWLLQQRQTRQDRILGVTFTRKASGEMQNRLNKLLIEQELSQSNLKSTVPDIVEETIGEVTRTPPGLDRVTLGTFHSICAKILRWNGDYLSTLPSVIDDMSKCDTAPALNGNFNIMDQGEQMRLLRDVLTENNIDMKQLDLKPLQVQSAIGRCKSMLADGKNPFSNQGANGKKQSVSPAMQVAQKIYYPYREKLLSTNCIDFDDLIYLARELLLVAEDVRDRLQKRWNHGTSVYRIRKSDGSTLASSTLLQS